MYTGWSALRVIKTVVITHTRVFFNVIRIILAKRFFSGHPVYAVYANLPKASALSSHLIISIVLTGKQTTNNITTIIIILMNNSKIKYISMFLLYKHLFFSFLQNLSSFDMYPYIRYTYCLCLGQNSELIIAKIRNRKCHITANC